MRAADFSPRGRSDAEEPVIREVKHFAFLLSCDDLVAAGLALGSPGTNGSLFSVFVCGHAARGPKLSQYFLLRLGWQ